MQLKVIFETSIINNPGMHSFLGHRDTLEQFAQIAKIYIPEIVIEEIKMKKRKQFIKQKQSLGTFLSFLGICKEKIENIDIEKEIIDLQNKETIPFQVIKLTNQKAFEQIKELALNNHAPFSKDNDKGFKDALIYFTVLEYLENCEKDDIVFFVTGDSRLKEAFEKEDRIKLIKHVEEIKPYSTKHLKEDYFIDKLNQELFLEISKDEIEDIWINIEDNWVLKISDVGDTLFVVVDFRYREIEEYTNLHFKEGINDLINSPSFLQTHDAIDRIKDYVIYFSNQQIQQLIEASVDNQQIYWIANDDDVKEFFLNLYEKKSQIIPETTREKFEQIFPIVKDIEESIII